MDYGLFRQTIDLAKSFESQGMLSRSLTEYETLLRHELTEEQKSIVALGLATNDLISERPAIGLHRFDDVCLDSCGITVQAVAHNLKSAILYQLEQYMSAYAESKLAMDLCERLNAGDEEIRTETIAGLAFAAVALGRFEEARSLLGRITDEQSIRDDNLRNSIHSFRAFLAADLASQRR